jgi:hypothetical protein
MTDLEIIMNFQGKNGRVELFKDKLIIKREGFLITEGEKTISLNRIAGIEVTNANWPFDGSIHFDVPGATVSTFESIKMEVPNSVLFAPTSYESATKLKNKIIELQHESKLNINQVVQMSNPDEIRKFKQLFDDGIITKEEFEKKKKELLGL